MSSPRGSLFLLVPLLLSAALFAGCAGTGSSDQGGSTVSSADAEKKRATLRKLRDDTLEDFYATKPEVRAEVERAVGYAVFDASQVNIVLFVGGLGGGVLVDNNSKKETFMKMTRVGTGPGVGYKSFRQLIVFKDKGLFETFQTVGADVGASADATMKIGGKGVAIAPNTSFNPLLSVYQITDRGALLQANWGGVAYLPDSALNR